MQAEAIRKGILVVNFCNVDVGFCSQYLQLAP